MNHAQRQLTRETLLCLFREHSRETPRIIIDMGFTALMKPGELRSLRSQVNFLYAKNKRSLRPSKIALVGLDIDSIGNLKKLGMEDWKNWGVQYTAQTLETLLQNSVDRASAADMKDALDKPEEQVGLDERVSREELIYLTADSDNVITELDPSKVYVVGGLVDKNRHKAVCWAKAETMNIPTAKFCLQPYFQERASRDGFVNKSVLAVNHVTGIINDYVAFGHWRTAFDLNVPRRRDRHSRRSASNDASREVQSALARLPVAVIIGGSSGIGLSFAKHLIACQYHVVITGRGAEKLSQAVFNLREQAATIATSKELIPHVLGFVGDSSKRSHMRRLKYVLEGYFARLNYVILCNGTFLWDADEEMLVAGGSVDDLLYEQNVLAKAYCVDALISLLHERIVCRNVAAVEICDQAHKCSLEVIANADQSSSEPASASKSHLLVIGSAAGKDGFKEMIEEQEGIGVVDNEQGYIRSMRSLGKLITKLNVDLKTGFGCSQACPVEIELIEPPLLQTPLTEAQFRHCDKFKHSWDTIQTSDEFVRHFLHQKGFSLKPTA